MAAQVEHVSDFWESSALRSQVETDVLRHMAAAVVEHPEDRVEEHEADRAQARLSLNAETQERARRHKRARSSERFLTNRFLKQIISANRGPEFCAFLAFVCNSWRLSENAKQNNQKPSVMVACYLSG